MGLRVRFICYVRIRNTRLVFPGDLLWLYVVLFHCKFHYSSGHSLSKQWVLVALVIEWQEPNTDRKYLSRARNSVFWTNFRPLFQCWPPYRFSLDDEICMLPILHYILYRLHWRFAYHQNKIKCCLYDLSPAVKLCLFKPFAEHVFNYSWVGSWPAASQWRR